MAMKELLASIFGSLLGLVMVDADHVLPAAYFHQPWVLTFFLFFGIGLFVFKKKKEVIK
jgi:hypothetical protein